MLLREAERDLDWRKLMGPTNTFKARDEAPHSSARASARTARNATHGSDSPASAARELKFFFPNLVLDPVPEGAAAREYVKANLSPTLIKAFAALCKEKPTANRLEALSWLARWLRENNPNAGASFAEDELALDPDDEDTGDFDAVAGTAKMEDAADVEEAMDDLEDQMRAATTVQSHFRGHQARRRTRRSGPTAAAAIAAASSSSRRTPTRTRSTGPPRSCRRATAGTGAGGRRRRWRRRRTPRRRSCRRVPRVPVEEVDGEDARRGTDAATKVQAGFRGHQDRKKVAEMKSTTKE